MEFTISDYRKKIVHYGERPYVIITAIRKGYKMFPWPEWLPDFRPIRQERVSEEKCDSCPLIKIHFAELNYRIKDLKRRLNEQQPTE